MMTAVAEAKATTSLQWRRLSDGGDGGDIVLVAAAHETTLLGYHRRPHRSSDNGGPGMGDNRSGFTGEDLELPVPIGTVVRDADGTELADLTEPGMRIVVAPGGRATLEAGGNLIVEVAQ